jgi:hypothetical protein
MTFASHWKVFAMALILGAATLPLRGIAVSSKALPSSQQNEPQLPKGTES